MNNKRLQSGFTLIELLVSMTITVVLLGVLVYMTGISMDTYKKSRNEVRASRQAKEALDTIAKDFESMISRRDGNTHEWLYAGQEPSSLKGPAGKEIANTSQLIFFTGATDRYNGQIGVTGQDLGGDVSAVAYRLVYRDQISNGPAADEGAYPVFSLYRHLVNPDVTFGVAPATGLLAEADLKVAYNALFDDSDVFSSANFLVENIYEFTVTFLVEYTPVTSGTVTAVTQIKRVTISESGDNEEFRIRGNEVLAGPNNVVTGSADTDILNGSIVGVEISISVLTDQGLVLAQKSGLSREELLKKHSYHYTKTINTPRP